jgi:uncharacterized protein
MTKTLLIFSGVIIAITLISLKILQSSQYSTNENTAQLVSNLQSSDSTSQLSDNGADSSQVKTPSTSIEYLRTLKIDSDIPVVEQELASGSNYKRYIASYLSEGNKIYGLLTVPDTGVPDGGFSAIVFNHGYIPPNQYVTTEKYVTYVDYLARNGFVVFKIDLRGHGKSEGIATGSYFSPKYTIDALSAVKSLQKLEYVNAQKIGMWGHSMAGNLTLRALLVEPDIRAGVIWAGAVYSYEDFAKYRLSDSSYVRQPRDPHYVADDLTDEFQNKVAELRENPNVINFKTDQFWSAVSLTQNIQFLNSPVQLHHAVNDPVVNIGYSTDLANILKLENKKYEIYEYQGGGHNIDSPYFEQAMQRTVEFFKKNL